MTSSVQTGLNTTASTRFVTTMMSMVLDVGTTAKSSDINFKNVSATTQKTPLDNGMTSQRLFMHMIGGWVLTAIFVFGILFMVVTHFLGRREWRRYQERLEEERNAVNHVLVDPKFMKYTKKGWREITLSL